jgi:aromatic-L-amino-acid decarboxylase
MDPEDFRREAHRVADWIADYFTDPGRYPVFAQVQPGEVRNALPKRAPDQSEYSIASSPTSSGSSFRE